MKTPVIFAVALAVIIGAMVVGHQLSDGGNEHFDQAGENWKQK